MNKMDKTEGLLQENNDDNYVATFNKTSLQQYNISLQSTSNVSSNIILEEIFKSMHQDVWNVKGELLNDEAINQIMNSANDLLHNADTSHMKNWKTRLDNVRPEALLEKSYKKCTNCHSNIRYSGLDQFQKNECNCGLGIVEENNIHTRELPENRSSIFVKNLNSEHSSQEAKSGEDQRQLLKPKFGKPRHAAKNASCPVTSEELEDQKSNAFKLTFKTAKEQLLSSNPAAKRTLGTSRKAQARFISPMIGAQDKQETSETEITDDKLKLIDPKMVELIENEIIDKGTPIGWDDIAGLLLAKSVIQEAVVWPLLRPDIFTGLRRPPKGILLFGPPGTGKTLIGRCVAAQCNATFFSISASSLTSKWIGDGEKMVRALFAVARCHQPAVIFIDEIDSLLTQRSDTEHESTRRIKTEFLVQFDGAATAEEDRLLIVGATNRPQELDEAARRRLVKRLYIPLPDADARKQIITNLLKDENNDMTDQHIAEIANLTEGYSGADMKSLCSEAAMGPIRSVPLSQIVSINRDQVRPVSMQDFINALQRVRPSVSQDDLGQYVKWNQTYGQGF